VCARALTLTEKCGAPLALVVLKYGVHACAGEKRAEHGAAMPYPVSRKAYTVGLYRAELPMLAARSGGSNFYQLTRHSCWRVAKAVIQKSSRNFLSEKKPVDF